MGIPASVLFTIALSGHALRLSIPLRARALFADHVPPAESAAWRILGGTACLSAPVSLVTIRSWRRLGGEGCGFSRRLLTGGSTLEPDAGGDEDRVSIPLTVDQGSPSSGRPVIGHGCETNSERSTSGSPEYGFGLPPCLVHEARAPSPQASVP